MSAFIFTTVNPTASLFGALGYTLLRRTSFSVVAPCRLANSWPDSRVPPQVFLCYSICTDVRLGTAIYPRQSPCGGCVKRASLVHILDDFGLVLSRSRVQSCIADHFGNYLVCSDSMLKTLGSAAGRFTPPHLPPSPVFGLTSLNGIEPHGSGDRTSPTTFRPHP